MTSGFDEKEWRDSAKDGPSFEFEPTEGGPGPTPDFEPAGTPPDPFTEVEDEAEQAHRAEWRSAEPPPREEQAYEPRPNRAEARRPGMPTEEERNFAMAAHAAGAIGALVSVGAVGWLVPLILWLVKKDEGGFAADQSREALNFQITMFILGVIGAVLTCIGIGVVIILLVWIAEIVYSIIGAVRTYKGERYEYPINFRLIADPAS